jgi:RimJ/RimL family protein N-acetyltransferase
VAPARLSFRYGAPVTGPLVLRALTHTDLAQVRPWFDDPDTRRFLGGPDWPARMLELGERVVGQEFRGAVQTGAYHYLATRDDRAVGYIDCGTFDRWVVYDGDHPDGPIRETLDVPTGYLALCVDPATRHQGVGQAMLAALSRRPELAAVRRLAAGVEPANHACVGCLRAAGFRPYTTEPDFEGMLYYFHDR